MTVKEYLDRFAEILPEGHRPTDAERRHAQELADNIQAYGGLVAMDPDGNPKMDARRQMVTLEYAPIRGLRFCIDPQARIWRFVRQGMARNPLNPQMGGVPRRNNAVEMWTGRWYKRMEEKPDGSRAIGYAKATHWVVLDRQVNRPRENLSAIDHYLNDKGYKHPLDPPDRPSKRELAVLERKATMTAAIVWAKMEEVAAEPTARIRRAPDRR